MSQVEEYLEHLISEGKVVPESTVVLASQYQQLRSLEYSCRVNYGHETQINSEKAEEWIELLKVYSPKAIGAEIIYDFRFSESVNNIRTSRKRHFKMNVPGLKFSSIHSYKGWDAKSVILLIDSADRNNELIYTAITRAKRDLYVINMDNQIYKEFFKTRISISFGDALF